MPADLEEKTDRYERLLAEALEAAEPAEPADSDGTIDERSAEECLEMAESYLRDGRHFREGGDDVNALASFSYGHGWLDAGARIGVLSVPEDGHLFTV